MLERISLQHFEALQSAVGIYNVSSVFGRMIGSGRDAVDLLHRMSTNEVLQLQGAIGQGAIGQGAVTILTTDKGRFLDLLTLLRTEHGLLITCSTGRAAEVAAWLDKYTIMEDARFRDASAEFSQYWITGSKAAELIPVASDLSGMGGIAATIGGIPYLLQRFPLLGEASFLLTIAAEAAVRLMDILEPAALELGGGIITDAEFDLLRIEQGLPLFSREELDKRNPLETTLAPYISFTKGCYIGQEVIARLDSYDKVQRHMMGVTLQTPVDGAILTAIAAAFELAHTSAPEPPSAMRGKSITNPRITNESGETVGELTSAAIDPVTESIVGLALIKAAYATANAADPAHSDTGKLLQLELPDSRIPVRLHSFSSKLASSAQAR